MNRYKKLKFVGEGSFARVYKVRDKKNSAIMALKCIQKAGKSEAEIEKLMQEIVILQSLSHQNIIRIVEWFDNDKDNEICVVTEFAEKGELFKIINHKHGTKKLSESDIKIIAKQLVSALQFLHSARIIHRDIKPQNILLSKSNVIKLCDFGFARALSEQSIMATSIKGTPLYMAPELVQEKPYNDRVDLWSLGVILYELYYGKPPFYTNSIYKLVRMIVKDSIRWPPQRPISKEFQHFINGLLQKNPVRRFNIEHLHQHAFLRTTPLTAPRKKATIKLKHRLNATAKKPPRLEANSTYCGSYLRQIHLQKVNPHSQHHGVAALRHRRPSPSLSPSPSSTKPAAKLIASPESKQSDLPTPPETLPLAKNKVLATPSSPEMVERKESESSSSLNSGSSSIRSSPGSSTGSASLGSSASSRASSIEEEKAPPPRCSEKKKAATIHSVKQKVLEIVGSRDWTMIDQILTVLPQRWHSLCSAPRPQDGRDMAFELNLFLKISTAFSHHADRQQSENANLSDPQRPVRNMLTVMSLAADTIRTAQCHSDQQLHGQFVAAMIATTDQILGERPSLGSSLAPSLCRFVDAVVTSEEEAVSKMVAARRSEIARFIIARFVALVEDKGTAAALGDVAVAAVAQSAMDIICRIMARHPMSHRLSVRRSMDWASDIDAIPLYAFWRDIECVLILPLFVIGGAPWESDYDPFPRCPHSSGHKPMKYTTSTARIARPGGLTTQQPQRRRGRRGERRAESDQSE